MENNSISEILWFYMPSKNGKKIQKWGIQDLGDGNFVTHEGYVDGKITVSAPTWCEPKNVGKKNETNSITQCALEVKARAEKKQKKGYSNDINSLSRPFVPTLAKEYKEHKNKIKFPAFCSRKLDGMRCVTKGEGMFSRERNEIFSSPHVREEMNGFFLNYCLEIVDGELYADKNKCNFNEIMSLVKQQTPNAEELQASKENIVYHVFDIVSALPFRGRIQRCKELFAGYSFVNIVEHVEVNSHEEIVALHDQYISEGFEGAMVRWGEEGYILERTDRLLKVKLFITEEFEILRVLDGRGKRANTVAKWECITKDGVIFEAGVMGTDEYNQSMWEIRDTLPGKFATIKFQEYTPDGAPRIGHCKEVRDFR